MGLNNFPYSNFHELNADWLIKTVKEWVEKNKEIAEKYDTLFEANEEFKTYVTKYLETLDISEEVRQNVITSLNEMIDNGDFVTLIAPLIQQISTPKVVTSINDMTDHNTIYLYSGNGNLYFWNGTTFANTGISYTYDNSNYLESVGRLPQGADLNDIHTNSVYTLQSNFNYSNLPDGVSAGTLITYHVPESNIDIQLAINLTTGYTAYRRYISSSWGSWLPYTPNLSQYLQVPGVVLQGGDLNNITDSSVYVLTTSYTYTNNPEPTGILITYKVSASIQFQIFIALTSFRTYYRRALTFGNYEDWYTGSIANHTSKIKGDFFGDSIMYGALGDTNNRVSLFYRIPQRIANIVNIDTVNSYAIGGTPLVPPVSDPTKCVYNQVSSVDISNSDIIVFNGGRNDNVNSLGDINSTSLNTIAGRVRQLIEYILSQNPQAQIFFLGLTPQGTNDDTIYENRYSGGWTMNEFEELMTEICNEYGAKYIATSKNITMFKHWSTMITGEGQDVTHPKDEKSYRIIGNFFGGQIAQYYNNN